MSFLPWCAVLLAYLAQLISCSEKPPPCYSDIYCHGPLLHTVQTAKLYEDSKTFVDMKMKQSPNQTMANFRNFMEKHFHDPLPEDVEQFLEDNFEEAGSEFTPWSPSDWTENPKYLRRIKDPEFRKWGAYLNNVWKDLGRKMKDDVKENQDLYSIIWVPNPVIVPGGRFREFYYWDSYWIIQGLLLSGMHATSRGMLENFMHIVESYGHIPNGGRIYYLERSQPPLLIPTVKLYADNTKDFDFVKNHIDTMDKEFQYWMNQHTKIVHYQGKNYTLAVYGDNSKGPRPESYLEDIETAETLKDDQKEEFYSELKAAAESGWDFSSRWFILNKTNSGRLINTKTRHIVPVDLNSFIYWNAAILRDFHDKLGNKEKAFYYREKSEEWLDAVTAVLWDEESRVWLDYDLLNSMRRKYFYPSNISPLFTGCYRLENKEKTIASVMKYLEENNIKYDGGIPTSMEYTGEQWDYPNAWPPLQHMVIVGLNNTGDAYAQRLAKELATIWLQSNYHAYKDTYAMYEKYDATKFGQGGGGGEYKVQVGFGWTNGIIIHLLNEYGGDITLENFVLSDNITTGSTLFKSAAEPTGSIALHHVVTIFVALVSSLVVYIGMSIYKRRNGASHSIWKKDQRPPRSHYTELRNIAQTKTIR